LPITSGVHAGRKFRLRPWQREIIKAIYRQDGDGRREVRTALLTLPRKNGKTSLAAALALAHFIGPECEQRGQCYSAAADREQASIIVREMKAMILSVKWMAERTNIKDFSREMDDAVTGSTFKALSADAKTKHGFSGSFVVYDELAQAPNRHLYDVLAI
jgi:phage terminase large subunit-like protein